MHARLDALRLAYHRLFYSPVGTLLSAFAIGFALALPTTGYVILNNLQQSGADFLDSQEISVFLQRDAPSSAVDAMASRLQLHTDIESTRYISKVETLNQMRNSSEVGAVLELLDSNPFPDTFVILPKNTNARSMVHLAREIRAWQYVEYVRLDSDWLHRVSTLRKLGHALVITLAIVLGAGLVAVIFNIVRLQLLTHHREIETSLMLGATRDFVSRPYYYFGVMQALLGWSTAWFLITVAYVSLADKLQQASEILGLTFSFDYLVPEFIGSMAISVLLGFLGAAFSLLRYLKKSSLA